MNWGHGKKANLKGKLSSRAQPVDFSDQRGIYVLYDGNFRVVYIGQTKDKGLLKRLDNHRKDHLAERWERFSWFGDIRVNATDNKLGNPNKGTGNVTTPTMLNHLEAVLIATTEPPHNRQGGRFGDSVERYLQCPRRD